MRDVHVEWRVVGHGPTHAEFVDQVVPSLAVALGGNDRAVEVRRRTGMDVASIDTQPLKYSFAGTGQLLNGVHDFDFFVQPEVPDQGFVGFLMDTRLVAAQIDGHPDLAAGGSRPQSFAPGTSWYP